VTQHDVIGRAATIGAVLATTLGLASCVAAAASAAVPEGAASQALAAEPLEEAAESAEEAEEATEEAAESSEGAAASSYVSSATPLPKDVERKIKRLTREINHVKSVRKRIHAKLVKLKQLPSTSKRREPTLTHAREKFRRKHTRLRHLRQERRKLAHS
jgi:predicted RNase H-like nuclease (RuvC/YqgF family)